MWFFFLPVFQNTPVVVARLRYSDDVVRVMVGISDRENINPLDEESVNQTPDLCLSDIQVQG